MIKKLSITGIMISAFVFGSGFSAEDAASAKHHSKSTIFQTINSERFSESDIQTLIDKLLTDWTVEQEQPKEEEAPVLEVPEETKETTPAEPAEEKQEEADQEGQEQANIENKQQEPVKEEPKESTEEAKQEQSAPTEEVKQDDTEDEPVSNDINQFEREVVELTNQERQQQGLPALKLDQELSKVARNKSQDMADNGYFSHNSPTYGSPFDMIQQAGINYQTAGENIAKGQRTPEEVVNGWMNSEGHRANILNGDFTHIGVGFVEDGNHWTQQFIGK
ncbi:CAP domain-containing protein [Gracilibacillus massiliensis]|uniref:CAP domain-containing protein n=1 Tax=Gracilibacillus massiliensis TaxID=1564956 RepID=UPI00071DB40F|nr:CAP domain-containing protein [Gracilibacillus massiliensis]